MTQIIAEIISGNIIINNIHIFAKREKEQNACFILAYSMKYDKRKKLKPMAGLACLGWEDEKEKLFNFFNLKNKSIIQSIMEQKHYIEIKK